MLFKQLKHINTMQVECRSCHKPVPIDSIERCDQNADSCIKVKSYCPDCKRAMSSTYQWHIPVMPLGGTEGEYFPVSTVSTHSDTRPLTIISN